jgi:crotonobetainyl-CoA:carnitine CoA-transferase CaiB-like acyl-CoA transferase
VDLAAPLDDLVVLDLTIARAGPTAVRHLADWGARVLRIEPTDPGVGLLGDPDTSDYINLHRSKHLIELDLREADDRRRFFRLVEQADVLVENNRPPVKAKLGIDYAACSAVNPRLVYGSISGYGQEGPASTKGAVDQIIQGVGGLMSITGLPDQGPGHLNVAAPSDRLWARLCAALEAPELATDARFATPRDRYRNRDVLNDELEARFARRSRDEWVAVLDAAGIPCGPVLAIDEVFADPQVEHLRMLERVDHPVRGAVDVLRNAITMSRSRPVPATSSPRRGRNRDDVLAEIGLAPLD